MFDTSLVNKRYFDITIEGVQLQVEPPKLKTLKKITSLSKVKKEDSIEELTEAVKMMLNKNKDNYTVSDELVEELDFDQLTSILTSFFEWLNNTKNSKN
jgi:hypothetical protein